MRMPKSYLRHRDCDMFLKTEKLNKVYPGCVCALKDVSIEVNEGVHLGIVGESGSGKTTLARVIMGLVNADSGHVVFKGQRLATLKDRRASFARHVRMVFQDPFSSLDPRFRVRALLKEALSDPTKGNIYTLPNMTPELVAALAAVGVKNQEELAEQATDELIEIGRAHV